MPGTVSSMACAQTAHLVRRLVAVKLHLGAPVENGGSGGEVNLRLEADCSGGVELHLEANGGEFDLSTPSDVVASAAHFNLRTLAPKRMRWFLHLSRP